MDRRHKKSQNAIFSAFIELLKTRRFENITVQEIIDEADVCRSTFYAHFETKDMLLDALCSNIFEHIFSDEICEYSNASHTLQEKLSHVLWHIKNDNVNIAGLLFSQSGELFTQYLKSYLAKLFCRHTNEFSDSVPTGFLVNHLAGSFCQDLLWWVKSGMKEDPETLAEYFISLTEKHK